MIPTLRRNADDEPLDVAVLGVGNIGAVHLQSAQALSAVNVVAAADAHPENLAWASDAGVTNTYDDYEELLAAEIIDVAIIALPPFLHRDAVETAAEAGVDVFVEKPLARSTEEADAMLSVAREEGISVGVDHTLRYQRDIRAVRDAYQSGHIGHVPFAEMIRVTDGALGTPPITDPPPQWQLDSDAAGGTLLELGVHCFDVLEWIFGPLEVTAVHLDQTLATGSPDAATVVLRDEERETTIVCHCGSYQWETLPDVNTRLRLEGVVDTAESANHRPSRFYEHAVKSALANVRARLTGGEPAVFGPTFYLEAHYAALEDFVDAIQRDEAPPVDGADGRRAVALAEEATDLASEQRVAVEAAEVPQ